MGPTTHQMNAASWKLTVEENHPTTPQADACSWKLTGEKDRVNHISECMLSEVNWRAHETHLNGHSITEVDWGGHDRSL